MSGHTSPLMLAYWRATPLQLNTNIPYWMDKNNNLHDIVTGIKEIDFKNLKPNCLPLNVSIKLVG